MNIDVVIPAYNEENSIGKVIGDIPKALVREVVVVNNNSTDNTVQNAETAGATVLTETEQGYGAACLKGIEYIRQKNQPPDIVVFIDGDYSDYPEEMQAIVQPILEQDKDMVIGSRLLGRRQKGAMMPHQIFGSHLVSWMLYILYKVKYTDLGPFRAIRWQKLMELEMRDRNYGWTVEMQVKAAKQKMNICEIPVRYRQRIGVSKITGTVKGTVMAGYKIITTVVKYW